MTAYVTAQSASTVPARQWQAEPADQWQAEPEPATEAPTRTSGIQVSGVTKRYSQNEVVRDVSLSIPPGGVTALVGPNGAGKSTLLSMISRLLPIDSGNVWVDGLDVTTCASKEMARKLAILRQDNHLAVRLTVRDLVAFGRYPHSHGRLRPSDKHHIDQAIDYLNLGELENRFLDQLSGGQRQRAFVAMVLCQDTDYLLLDEPLNNLDMAHAAAMMRLLRNAAHELNKTVVIVIHDINFASCHADRIIGMRDGIVVSEGSAQTMMCSEVLHDIFGVEVPVHDVGGKRIGIYY